MVSSPPSGAAAGHPQDGLARLDFMRQGQQPLPGQPQPLQLLGRQKRPLQGPLLATQAGRSGGERVLHDPPLRLNCRLPRGKSWRWRRYGRVEPFEGTAHTLDRTRVGILGQSVGSESERSGAFIGQLWLGTARSGSGEEVGKGRTDR